MKRSNTTDFIQKAKQKHGDTYDYSLVEYQLARIKVKIVCPVHGAFEQRPNDHLRGDKCPRCKFDKIAAMKRSTVQDFAARATKIHNNRYDYSLVKYKNAITKVNIVCPEHGSFKQTPDKHLGGTGCPKCSYCVSRGEREVMSILDRFGIKYEREKRFPGLCGSTKNSRLRYDFWLPDHNLLIEYDGEQHFKPIRTRGRLSENQAATRYAATKINDKKKNAYAKKNGYKLLRIRYDEDIQSALGGLEELRAASLPSTTL